MTSSSPATGSTTHSDLTMTGGRLGGILWCRDWMIAFLHKAGAVTRVVKTPIGKLLQVPVCDRSQARNALVKSSLRKVLGYLTWAVPKFRAWYTMTVSGVARKSE